MAIRSITKYNQSLPAFTLIELIVVIAIIGILIAASAVIWGSVAARGRDANRKSDLARLKQVLLQQYSDTRTYPAFDDSHGLIYGASWQLAGSGLSCTHDDSNRILTKYLDKIPTDPKDATSYTNESCTSLAKNQSNRYLYITSPTSGSGPTDVATGFTLMATLEQSIADRVNNNANPLKQTVAPYGSWYASFANYNSPINVNANYLVNNQSH